MTRSKARENKWTNWTFKKYESLKLKKAVGRTVHCSACHACAAIGPLCVLAWCVMRIASSTSSCAT